MLYRYALAFEQKTRL